MNKIAFIAVMVLAMACSSSKHGAGTASGSAVSASGTVLKDGSSFENAIVLKEKSETAGVNAEYAYIREHYPGSTNKGQALLHKNGKSYDLMTFVTADGTDKKLYFDISNFFGKF